MVPGGGFEKPVFGQMPDRLSKRGGDCQQPVFPHHGR